MGTVKAIDIKENERVRVIVRCRPMNLKELRRGFDNVVDVHPSVGAIEIFNPKENDEGKTFTFDAVYDCDSTQDDIYEESVKPVVDSVLSGFNGTIFAYGQTGTGKTFTMEGSRYDPLCKGVIPKSFEQIFNHIVRSKNIQYLVRASYIEIYQEEVQDLLDGSGKTCYELRGNSSNVFIKNLKSHVCKSAKEMEEVMHHGNRNRKIGKTDMNDHSSRSHAIFIITVEMSTTVSGIYQVRVGKLNLVDLAGSERQSKSCSSGERLKEATKINLSLSALGNVISALSRGKSLHIPYRDSKLTRLLQDSLGGNSKTLMIANIGPASYNYDESLTTLRYANRAKNIKNKPRINEELKDTLIREYQNEIKRLKALLQSKLANKLGNESTGNNTKSEKNRIKIGNMNVRNSINRRQLQQSIKSTSLCDDEKATRLKEEEKKEKNLQALSAEKKVIHALKERIKLMESKLLNGTNMVDHTNAQKEILQLCADEIKQKTKSESELRHRLLQEEKTTEQLQQSIRNLQKQIKDLTEAIDNTFYKFQAVKKQTIEIMDNFDGDREGLEKVQNNSIKNYKLNQIIVDNFISEQDVNKFTSNLYYDKDNEKWTRYNLSVDIQKKNSSTEQNENKPEDECIRVPEKVNS